MLALVITLVLATAVGLAVQRRNGRFRDVRPAAAPTAPGETSLAVPGARATFVQLSAEHCAVCPSVARTLEEVAAAAPGIAHVELRAEDNLELVRRYDVRRSPTVLLVDAAGHVVARTSGAMSAQQARAALATMPGVEARVGARVAPHRPPAADPRVADTRPAATVATDPIGESIDARV